MKEVGKYEPDPYTRISTLFYISTLLILYHLLINPLSLMSIFAAYDVKFFLFASLVLTLVIQHELIHYVMAKLLGHGTQTKLNLTSIEINSDYIKKAHLIAITLAPVIVLTLFYAALALVFERFSLLFLLAGAINFLASKKDISTASKALNYKGTTYFTGEPHTECIIVYKKKES
jgi:hypothetical protein